MLNYFKKLLRRKYSVLNQIEISRQRLLHNYSVLTQIQPSLAVAPVLKSNAYGHGLREIAQILNDHYSQLKYPFVCVDSLYEAYELSKLKFKSPVLIMGYSDPENLKIKPLPFQYAVWDKTTLEVLNRYQPQAQIHLFVDTGMHREGVLIEDLPNFLQLLLNYPNVKLVGLISHLASAISASEPLFKIQLKNYRLAKKMVLNMGFKPRWFHLAASEAYLNPDTRKEVAQLTNLSRVGKLLYGILPNQFSHPTQIPLQPVLRLTTKLIQIKKLKKGDRVGYSGTYTASQDRLIGVLPIGYYDGIDRRLSNKGVVLINQTPCPIIGRVNMNITTVDVTEVADPQIGQEVVVYSNNPDDPNSIEKVAQLCDTIAYEILTRESATTRRVVTD